MTNTFALIVLTLLIYAVVLQAVLAWLSHKTAHDDRERAGLRLVQPSGEETG